MLLVSLVGCQLLSLSTEPSLTRPSLQAVVPIFFRKILSHQSSHEPVAAAAVAVAVAVMSTRRESAMNAAAAAASAPPKSCTHDTTHRMPL